MNHYYNQYYQEIGAVPRYGLLRAYLFGGIGSLACILAAYALALRHAFTPTTLPVILGILALAQFFAQTVYFLHLGPHHRDRARLGIFIGTLGVVLILVGGSLWIMANLNARMMTDPASMGTDAQMQYMQHQAGI